MSVHGYSSWISPGDTVGRVRTDQAERLDGVYGSFGTNHLPYLVMHAYVRHCTGQSDIKA
jgi:hypothetical protein